MEKVIIIYIANTTSFMYLYGGQARQQGIHLRRLGKCNFPQGDPLWLHHHRSCKEAEADVPHKDEDLSVLRCGLHKGPGHEVSAPEHTDVWLWGLKVHYGWWPLLQQQGC